MKSEMQFFLISEDDHEILNQYKNRWDLMEENISYLKLCIGKNFIQFQPSVIYLNQLTAGRIAYMTIDQNDNRAETLYKEMKNYIKKITCNNMVVESEYTEVRQVIKTFYYSTRAFKWLLNSQENRFVQFKDGGVTFTPQQS